jgi:predicted nucleic acid-binding protein
LIAEGGTVSVQVLSEFAAIARRKAKMPWDEVRFAIENIKTLCPDPLPITLATHRDALSLAERYGFGIHDALIVASALEAKCTTLVLGRYAGRSDHRRPADYAKSVQMT